MATLTEKWRQGKLPDGLYWVKYKNGFIDIGEHITHHNGFCYEEKKLIEEVLAEVPSYDEWQTEKQFAQDCFNHLQEKREEYLFAVQKIIQLKEILKECRGLMNCTKDWACTEATEEMIKKINQVLGE